jgi:hypothetical protein
MSLAWVAGSVRASLLASRRLGPAGARALAQRDSLETALAALAESPYGRDVASATTLEEAQRAVAATLLWNLRVLAGWLPPAGAELLRVMAAWFEIANVQDRLAYLGGAPFVTPFTLGGLATAWPALASTGSLGAVRAVLAGSHWGDPGSSEPVAIVDGMRNAWARRVAAVMPEAAGWARSAAALLTARTARPAGKELVALEIDAPEDLWQAEARWWSRVEREAARLAAARRQGSPTVVGVVGLLAADAWRVRAALAAAALGPGGREAFDAVA